MTSTGLCMMTERHHGGGRLAQGPEVERPGKGRADRGVLSAGAGGGRALGRKGLQGASHAHSKGSHGGRLRMAQEAGLWLQRSPEHKPGKSTGWRTALGPELQRDGRRRGTEVLGEEPRGGRAAPLIKLENRSGFCAAQWFSNSRMHEDRLGSTGSPTPPQA